MTGTLHKVAVAQALQMLGPGSSKKNFRKNLWKNLLRHYPALEGGDYDSDIDWLAPGQGNPIRIVPDAHVFIDLQDGSGLLIDLIEVDGTSKLEMKLGRYEDFAFMIDSMQKVFLRLRILSVHGMLIGEYDECGILDITLYRRMKYSRGVPSLATPYEKNRMIVGTTASVDVPR